MKRGDIKAVAIIGALVGILIQPILANTALESHLTLAIRAGIFLAFLIIAPVALFIAWFIEKVFHGIYQFAKFAAVGTLNSFIDIGVFNLETFLYGLGPLSNGLFAVFKAISFLFSTTNSYFWNKHWTFGSGENARASQVGAFYGIAAIGWVLNVAAATLVRSLGPTTGSESIIKLWVNIVAPLAGVAISFIWNFIGYKYFVFKRSL